MGKICPLISGDEGGAFKEIRLKECQEKNCAWWVSNGKDKGGKEIGECAMTSLASTLAWEINCNVRTQN